MTTTKLPCQYSLEELKARVEESVLQYERGDSFLEEEIFELITEYLKGEVKKSEEAFDKKLFVTQEDMRKRHPRI